ncbi:MAG: glycosyltransferase family 87 protein [Bdellovibrionales bacterium]
MSFLNAIRQGNWLNRRRVRDYPRIFLIVFVLFGVAWGFGLHQIISPEEEPIVTDFINVYSAGLAVHEGSPAEAYDWRKQKAREYKIEQSLQKEIKEKSGPDLLPWLYPPMFFGIAWLVAFLPYWSALAAYSLVGFVVYAVALRKLAPPHKESWAAVVAFPGAFINLFAGQNGSITATLMAAGLYLLDTSPIAAGIILGALSYKPHLFALIPLVLLVGGYWRALAAVCLSACAYAGLSIIAFGPESWSAFFESTALSSSLLKDDSIRWLGILHSVFSAVRVFGGSISLAMVIQGIVALCVLAILIIIWREKTASLAVRGASLAAAVLLISPYSFVYDQVLLAIPIALLAKEGIEKGFLSYEKTFLFALWLLPFLVQDSGIHFALPLTPPMLIGLMAICWRKRVKKGLASVSL